jgi:hypothetical protein
MSWERIFPRGKWLDCVLLILLCTYGLYVIRAIFGSGYFYDYDLNQHLTESVYVATVLLPKYHELVGWNPYYYLGWPQGQFNPPASYLVYSLFYYALSWAVSPLAIFKVMIAFFFLLQGIAVYFAARGFGLGRPSAFIGGFITLGTAGGFETGGPLAAMFYGMYEFALAIALIPLALAIFHQSFVRKSLQLLLLTALLVAFDFLLHTLAGAFLVLVLLVYTVAELFRSGLYDNNSGKIRNMGKTILKFVIVGLIVAGICSFWVIPAYLNRGFYSSQLSLVTEFGNYATTYNDLHIGFIFGEESSPLITNLLHFSSTPTLTPMLYDPNQVIMSTSTPTFYQLLLGLALIGAIVSLIRAKTRFPVLVVLFLIGIFIFISLGPNYYEMLWKIPSFHYIDLRPGRAASVARVFLAIIGGAGVGETFTLANMGIKKIGAPRNIALLLKIGTVLVIVVLGLTLLVNSYALMNQLPLGYTTSQLAGGSDLPQVFSWMKQNVPNDTRVAFQEYPQQGHPQHLFAVAPLETGDPEIGSNYGFWWSGADTTNVISEILTSEDYYGPSLYTTLAGLNAGYVVMWGFSAMGLSDYPSNFQLMKTIGQFQIYKLKDFTPSYVAVQNGTGNATVSSFQPEQIVIHLQNVTAGSSLLVRESYYSNWVAYAKGSEIPVSLENVSLPLVKATYMRITLPANGTYYMTLSYNNETNADVVGNDISYFSLISFFVASVFVVLDSRTKYPIAEYLALVVTKTNDTVRSTVILNASERGGNKLGPVDRGNQRYNPWQQRSSSSSHHDDQYVWQMAGTQDE